MSARRASKNKRKNIYRRLGGVIGVSRPLTGKSFRFVRACDAKLCVSARRMRFRLLGLHTDLQRRRACGRPRDFVVFWFKKCTTLARNRHFWLKMFPLSYGIVVFASTSKNAPTSARNRHFWFFMLLKCSHSFTESSFLLKNVPTPLRNRHFCFLAFLKCSHSFTE